LSFEEEDDIGREDATVVEMREENGG